MFAANCTATNGNNDPEWATALKATLWKGTQPPEEVWARLKEAVEHEIKIIREANQKGISVIPEVLYEDLVNGTVPNETLREIRKRGTAVVRGVVPQQLVETWAREAEEYVTENDYHRVGRDSSSSDSKNFFAEATPQIYGVYWNKPQVQARQHPNMQTTRGFLNSLWSNVTSEGEWRFDPTKESTYADRQRIRLPGNVSGLVPHIDGGSIERWTDPGYQKYYQKVFEGRWEELDPWAGEDRVFAQELPSPNVSTVFRTYQGWLALSEQGKGDGTLQVVPLLRETISYLLMRPFLSDATNNEDPFCGAFEGRQHKITTKWHNTLLEGLVSIPKVNPGDTVWWHPDIIHAVEKEHLGKGKASVFYIGAAPLCIKNAKYLRKQRASFLTGEAGPDFPQEGKEIEFKNRATVKDLSTLGKYQMGFAGWELTGTETPQQIALLRDCALEIYQPSS